MEYNSDAWRRRMSVLVIAFLITIPMVLLICRSLKTRVKYPPGPIALPIIGHLHLLWRRPLLHRSFSKLSSRYGPLMYLRLGSQQIVDVSSPEMASTLFKNHDIAFSQRQENICTNKLKFGGLGFGLAPYGPYWSFAKKLVMTELLGPKALQRTAALRTRELHHFIGNLLDKSKASESVNLTKELHKMAGNNMSMMMFSKRCITTPIETEEFIDLISSVTGIGTQIDMIEMFLGPLRKYSGLRKRMRHTFRRFNILVEKIVTDREHMRRMKKDDDHVVPNDFLDILLDLVDHKTSDDYVEAQVKITRKHAKGLVTDLLVASTDSTVAAVDWVMVQLLHHPEIMKKAQEEVDKVVGSESRIVNESDNEHLSYIVAIIKETLRLHPPLPLFRRVSTQECTINGFTIPSGAVLTFNTWAMGRDPKVWDNPTEFRPERFLSDHADVEVTGNHYQLLPFGSGRRRCPAINLAMETITTTVAALVQCFDWEELYLAGHESSSTMDMSERPGVVVPRRQHFECIPLTRYTPKLLHQW